MVSPVCGSAFNIPLVVEVGLGPLGRTGVGLAAAGAERERERLRLCDKLQARFSGNVPFNSTDTLMLQASSKIPEKYYPQPPLYI